MSRSYRKIGMCHDNVSDSRFSKRRSSRSLRHKVKQTIKTKNIITESIIYPIELDVQDFYWRNEKFRFDPIEWPEGLRK